MGHLSINLHRKGQYFDLNIGVHGFMPLLYFKDIFTNMELADSFLNEFLLYHQFIISEKPVFQAKNSQKELVSQNFLPSRFFVKPSTEFGTSTVTSMIA